ncbi:argininosuccinate lyase [Meiothermus sp. QL-1]|uniref:lyase family protein n=1 Tax=Meiothermus sp. QL-1 TaxID=2058095 RepID=UPI000E0BA324|nr:lyase family protein [Meiothermus sp. QL-1]RDI95063.1 argininosuccinate lyase [Meiothermus sp. QL-1]
MRWHNLYRRWVLGRHFRFAREHLSDHFFDALTAYALGLARLQVPGAVEAAYALSVLRREPVPGFSGQLEDIFFTIDSSLRERFGPEVAGALRRGLSRNDLDLTVFRAYAAERMLRVLTVLSDLRRELLHLGQTHRNTLLTAYTHHRPAQPTTLGHYLTGVENLLSRDYQRLRAAFQTTDKCPLGASTLAGSPYPVDRKALAQWLGFGGTLEHTYDAIAAGDWALEIAHALAGLATSLSRLVADLLFWAEQGGFLVAERISQGSSVMPQKVNPVVLEHVRGFLAELMGGPATLGHLNYSTPFGDVNDHGPAVLEPLQSLFYAAEGAMALLRVALQESRFVPEVLAQGLRDRSVLASELVDALVARRHLPLAEAYPKVQRMLRELSSQGRTVAELGLDDLQSHLGFGDPELLQALEPERFIARRKVLGGAAPEAQAAYLDYALGRLRLERLELKEVKNRRRRALRTLAAEPLSLINPPQSVPGP